MDRAFAGAAPHLRDAAGRQVTNYVMARPPKRNVRTGLVLLTIVLAFFAGIMVKTWLFGL